MINYALNKYNRCKLSINGGEIKNMSEALHCVTALCHCTVTNSRKLSPTMITYRE